MVCVSRVCTARRSSYLSSSCDLRRVRVTTLSHKHIHNYTHTVTSAHTCVVVFSISLALAHSHTFITHNQPITHAPTPPSLPRSHCLCHVVLFRNRWRGPRESRGNALGVWKVPSTHHPYSTLTSYHISFPALSFCYESSPWNAALNDWFILCQTVLGSAQIIKAAKEGRLDDVSRWLAENPQLVNAKDVVCPLT
jgi:hypothetical protein